MSYPQDFPFGIMDVVELLHLRIRRRGGNSVYVDCPFCGDQRGKMNINYLKNVWRCNYCDESGGMLALYAGFNNTTKSNAYWEICDALQTENVSSGYPINGKQPGTLLPENKQMTDDASLPEIPQSPRAGISEIHQTLSLLFSMLSLSGAHRKHLSSPKRGLSEQQINELGFKSTPPSFLCYSLTSRLLKQGCTVQGVPGFYQDDSGKWTINFNQRTSGILIPAVGIDGMIHGSQIMLDIPIKDKNDPPEKKGTKYIWLSSSKKNMGVTSGSPVHFVGSFARTIYVTEGLLKADIAHCLMNRSFIGIAGANNVQQLEPLFALLAQNGTELIVEAHDMDKYNNKMTNKGASKIHLMAHSKGMECRTLTWNPNYKGIDDWQLALHQKEESKKGKQMNFKQRYLSGQCDFSYIDDCVAKWHNKKEDGTKLVEYLGLSKAEYEEWLRDVNNMKLKELLDLQRQHSCFRIYQLDFGEKRKAIPFAFLGIEALHKAGYEQPPAADYRLICDDKIICPKNYSNADILNQIFKRYNQLPENYPGRPLSSSDIVELYSKDDRSYFYRDTDKFIQVRFSPFLAKPLVVNISTPEDTA